VQPGGSDPRVHRLGERPGGRERQPGYQEQQRCPHAQLAPRCSICLPKTVIAERQFNLSFLNTAVDALALIVFGVALAVGVVAGEGDLLLTLLPAALAAGGVATAR